MDCSCGACWLEYRYRELQAARYVNVGNKNQSAQITMISAMQLLMIRYMGIVKFYL